jgi:hypothetical protein
MKYQDDLSIRERAQFALIYQKVRLNKDYSGKKETAYRLESVLFWGVII